MKAAEVRYAFLDQLPERLFRATVANIHGRLIARGEAIVALRESLLNGELPTRDVIGWPESSEMRHTLLEALRDANVAPYCAGDTEITDEILLFVLQVVDDAYQFYDRALIAFHTLARKDEVDFVSLAPSRGDAWTSSGGVKRFFDERDWDKARADAAKLMAIMLRSRTTHAWQERIAVMSALERVFDQLAQCVGLPPGTGRGMLRSLDRDNVLELQRAMRHLPTLEALIRTLGRMKATDEPNASTALERIGRSVERIVEVNREVQGDFGIEVRGIEVRGIERSGEVARMLPSEAALLTSSTLRRLWLARWTERTLLTYHAPGVLTERMRDKQTFEDGEITLHERAERGPIQIILDTSASMAGTPETIAKAIALQILAVAHTESRRCYIYNFSGPGDIVEHDVSFAGDGLMRTLAFISCSFHGGTEPDEALRRACRRLRTDDWRQADIVMVSDGEFCIPEHIRRTIERTRLDSAARFHAVRTGAGAGFDAMACDSLHDVADWLPKTPLLD